MADCIQDAKLNPQNLTNTYTEDILNSILPPREYTTEKQQLWY
jgi:dynein light intermediate chain